MTTASHLKTQHFRSLADIHLKLPNLTVLVGTNSTGKSNFIDIFRFLRDTTAHGLGHAVDHRGGLSIVRQYSSTRPYNVSIGIELTEADPTLFCKYSLRFSGTNSRVRVEHESASWVVAKPKRPRDQRELIFDVGKTSDYTVECGEFDRDREGHLTLSVEGHHSVLRMRYHESVLSRRGIYFRPGRGPTPLQRFLWNARFASVYPNILRVPQRLETDRTLKEDCSNWGSIIRRLRQTRHGQIALDRVLELMKIALPELIQISVKNVGGYVVPQFLVDSHKGSNYFLDPIQLSDGTLRIFGLLLHLYQQPQPSFLAMEEPEQTIHPGLLNLLVDAINEASMSMQIVLTTHSPYVLDFFPVECLRVVTLEKGETKISKIRESQLKAVKDGLMTASEIMAFDGLQPERS